jgi:hypothetical protein
MDSEEERNFKVGPPKGYQYMIAQPDFEHEGAPIYLDLDRERIRQCVVIDGNLAAAIGMCKNLSKLVLKEMAIQTLALDELKQLHLTDLVLVDLLPINLEGLADMSTVFNTFSEMQTIQLVDIHRQPEPASFEPFATNDLSEEIDLLSLLQTSWPNLKGLKVSTGLVSRFNHAEMDIRTWKCFSGLEVLQFPNTRLPQIVFESLVGCESLQWMDLTNTRQNEAWKRDFPRLLGALEENSRRVVLV